VVANRVSTVAYPPDDRSPLSVALAKASQLTAIALEMVVPIAAGYWADQWLGTGLVFVVAGAVLGLIAGMLSLLRLAERPGRSRKTNKGGHDTPPDQVA